MVTAATCFILHHFWSSKRKDSAQALAPGRDFLRVICQVKWANSHFLVSRLRTPSLPQTQRYPLAEWAFQSVLHRPLHLLSWLPPISPLCPSLPCTARQRKASVSRIAQDLTEAPFLSFWQGNRVRCFSNTSCMGSGGKGWKKPAISVNMCHLGACLILIST